MRKIVCIFSAIIIMAGVFSIAPVAAGADENDAYANIIMVFKQVVRDANYKWITGDYGTYGRPFDWEPLSRVHASIFEDEESLTACFGYAYHDINDDQRPELLLLTKDAYVLAVFTQTNSGTPAFFGMSAYDDVPDRDLCFMLPDNNLAVYRMGVDDGSIQESRLNGAGDSLVRTNGIGWEITDEGEYVRYSIGGDGVKTRISDEGHENFETQWEWYNHNLVTREDLAFIPLFGPDEIAEMSVVQAPDARFEEMATLISDLTVNIRSGPGTKYAQIGEAYPGASFYYTGITKDGFLEIMYPDIRLISVLAYVNKDLAEVSRVGAEDVVYSSVAGYLRVKPKTQVYFDASLSKKAKQTLGGGEDVPFAGVSSSGSYAVLYTTVNKKQERLLWIGYVSPKDVVEVSALGETAGVAEEERTDALVDMAVIELIDEFGKESIGIVVGMVQTPEGRL